MGRGIEDYRRKRDFERTPEPKAGRARRSRAVRNEFVVHRHEARNLHYDLRLEMEGVLRSWAVPRGFSYDPKDKHLAVRTEDHPLEYLTFDGVIPKGEYGAGTMGIWDRGTYTVHDGRDPAEAVGSGELKVVLSGRRLRGEWHMVRTKGDGEPWLLFKARDRYAATEDLRGVDYDLTGARSAAVPRSFRPKLPGVECAVFSDPNWVFEMEFVGRRAWAVVAGGRVSWRGLGSAPPRAALSALTGDLAALRAGSAVVDGVLVALDELGRPDRRALERRMAGDSAGDLFFYAFDLLHFDGLDLCGLPLLERKAVLRTVLPSSPRVLFVDHLAGSGESLAEVGAAAGLQAILAKRATGRYAPGEQDDWRRIALAPVADARELSFDAALDRAGAHGRKTRTKFSNLDKIYWPREGYTKGDLIAYYDQVAEHILPYLHDRPCNMLRYPDGIEGESFYQHKAPDGAPSWLDTVELSSSGRGESQRHVVCNDRDALLYLINLGSIDLHPWSSRRDTPDSPDWLILDLDPKEAPFAHVVRIARELGKILRGIGLRPSLKTSGKTGLHIYVGLVPGYTYEQVRMFSEGVARTVVRVHREIATVERDTSQRGGKVYVDFGQNRRGQTVVPPYVIRPVPGARVSAPLDWDELHELDRDAFNMVTMPARIAEVGDLFRGVLDDRQELGPAIDALREYV